MCAFFYCISECLNSYQNAMKLENRGVEEWLCGMDIVHPWLSSSISINTWGWKWDAFSRGLHYWEAHVRGNSDFGPLKASGRDAPLKASTIPLRNPSNHIRAGPPNIGIFSCGGKSPWRSTALVEVTKHSKQQWAMGPSSAHSAWTRLSSARHIANVVFPRLIVLARHWGLTE